MGVHISPCKGPILSVGTVCHIRSAKMAEAIEMPFGMWSVDSGWAKGSMY